MGQEEKGISPILSPCAEETSGKGKEGALSWYPGDPPPSPQPCSCCEPGRQLPGLPPVPAYPFLSPCLCPGCTLHLDALL